MSFYEVAFPAIKNHTKDNKENLLQIHIPQEDGIKNPLQNMNKSNVDVYKKIIP
jgi:hypothetical protein